MVLFLALLASLSYALSVYIDSVIYYLKYLLISTNGVKYWLSMLTIFQYSARFFMLLYLPTLAYLTEGEDSLELTTGIVVIGQILAAFLLILSSANVLGNSRLVLFIITSFSKLISGKSSRGYFSSPKDFGWKPTINNKDSYKLFGSAFLSQFLIAISMSLVFLLNFVIRDQILFLNSLMQLLNMFASILLFIVVDPIIMDSFHEEYSGSNNIKIVFVSRISAHTFASLVFTLFYFFGT